MTALTSNYKKCHHFWSLTICRNIPSILFFFVLKGFHNWVFFSKEESNNKLNYKGRIGTAVNLGSVNKSMQSSFVMYIIRNCASLKMGCFVCALYNKQDMADQRFQIWHEKKTKSLLRKGMRFTLRFWRNLLIH